MKAIRWVNHASQSDCFEVILQELMDFQIPEAPSLAQAHLLQLQGIIPCWRPCQQQQGSPPGWLLQRSRWELPYRPGQVAGLQHAIRLAVRQIAAADPHVTYLDLVRLQDLRRTILFVAAT